MNAKKNGIKYAFLFTKMWIVLHFHTLRLKLSESRNEMRETNDAAKNELAKIVKCIKYGKFYFFALSICMYIYFIAGDKYNFFSLSCSFSCFSRAVKRQWKARSVSFDCLNI